MRKSFLIVAMAMTLGTAMAQDVVETSMSEAEIVETYEAGKAAYERKDYKYVGIDIKELQTMARPEECIGKMRGMWKSLHSR